MNLALYLVWIPMLATDNESEAQRVAASAAKTGARQFYDAKRRVGIAFVEDHFQALMRDAIATLPKENPFWQRLLKHVDSPADEHPLWDAVLMFRPGVEWRERSPRPDWWAKQTAFFGGERRDGHTGMIWSSRASQGPVESDWLLEIREGLRVMAAQKSE